MTIDNFSKWSKWDDRNNILGSFNPGIYIIAISDKDLSNTNFSWIGNIVYVGMTNSAQGLKGRLSQFDKTIAGLGGRPAHGGADRMRYKHRKYIVLKKNLYVSIYQLECNVKSKKPNDLRTMGEVAKLEYVCFAEYVEKYGEMPEFNKITSLKYSKKIGWP